MVVLQIGIPKTQIRNINPITCCQKIFSEEVCRAFITVGQQSGTTLPVLQDQEKQHFKFIDLNLLNPAISEILKTLVTRVNASSYNFFISELNTGYLFKNEPGSFSDWYVDLGDDEFSTTRKLTVLLFLNTVKEYKGGEASFLVSESHIAFDLGTVLIFPSYQLYKFEPVRKGTQYVFACWACGPAFH